MQKVLQAARNCDPEAAAWLEVIDRFDAAAASRASIRDLARIANDTSGRSVGVRDEWMGLRIGVTKGMVLEGDHMFGADIVREALTCRLRGRNAGKVQLPAASALAASIEAGSGRFGLAWLSSAKRCRWKPLDYLVVERLAVSVTALALQRSDRGNRSGFDPAAVERLLAGGLSEHELAQTSRYARLSPERRYVAIALAQSPPNAVSLDALGAIVERAIQERGGVARTTIIGRTSAVVALFGDYLDTALDRVVNDSGLGFVLHAGVGDPVSLSELPTSWDHARESLALCGVVGRQINLVYFRDLGILHLLAQIPKEEIVASDLFQKLTGTLAHRGNPSDIEVLEAYLAEGTLRRTAARVFLHHTTVDHRLKRIEEQLELDLSEASARFQIGLLLKLHRIVRAHDAAQR